MSSTANNIKIDHHLSYPKEKSVPKNLFPSQSYIKKRKTCFSRGSHWLTSTFYAISANACFWWIVRRNSVISVPVECHSVIFDEICHFRSFRHIPAIFWKRSRTCPVENRVSPLPTNMSFPSGQKVKTPSPDRHVCAALSSQGRDVKAHKSDRPLLHRCEFWRWTKSRRSKRWVYLFLVFFSDQPTVNYGGIFRFLNFFLSNTQHVRYTFHIVSGVDNRFVGGGYPGTG